MEHDWRARLGREIRTERARLGWTQKQLAEKATPLLYPDMAKEISTDTIHRIEHGDNTRTDMLHALATALDVQVRVRLRPRDETGIPSTNTDEPEQPETENRQGIRPDQPLLAHPPTLSHGKEVDPANPLDRIATAGAQIMAAAEELRQSWQPVTVARGGGSSIPPRARKARTIPRHPTHQKPAGK